MTMARAGVSGRAPDPDLRRTPATRCIRSTRRSTSSTDLAGLKIRTPSRTGSFVLEALGANPVGMPVPQLPQALSKDVVDGTTIPYEIVAAAQDPRADQLRRWSPRTDSGSAPPSSCS